MTANKRSENRKESGGHRNGGGLLEKAARKVGSALGAVVAKTGHGGHHEEGAQPRIVAGKYQKSGKHRLPRKLKKQRQKTAELSAAASARA